MRPQRVDEWRLIWVRGDRRLWGPFTFHSYAESPHRHMIKDATGLNLVLLTLLWSPTPEEIATYLNTAEVYYADDIQQEE